MTSVVRAIRDGDTIEVLSYFCRVADESIGGVLKGATTSLDGVHDGLGAVLDTAAATMTRVPVAGDVAGGGVNAARHVLSAAFGAVRGVVSGAFLGCRAYVRGARGSGIRCGPWARRRRYLLLVWPMARGIWAAARAGVGGRAARRRELAVGPVRRLFEECRAARPASGARQWSARSRRRRGGLRRLRLRRHAARGPGRVLEASQARHARRADGPVQFCGKSVSSLFGAFAALLGVASRDRRRSRRLPPLLRAADNSPRATASGRASCNSQPL